MGTFPFALAFGSLFVACQEPVIDSEIVDVSERLAAGEVRTGIIEDERALFGGVSAEGQIGDYKIYNDRVQFIIQGIREGSYYLALGGVPLDLDVVRPEGQPGRDTLDEFAMMAGLGRVVAPDRISVVNSGINGEPAIIQVDGHAEGMALLNGALEIPDFVEEFEASVVTTYTLAPNSSLLEITSTVTWLDQEETIQTGDFAMISGDTVSTWRPEIGFADNDGLTSSPEWVGALGNRGEVALALFPEESPFPPSAIQELLSEFGSTLSGFQQGVSLSDGDTYEMRRFLGVGMDFATLTNDWYRENGLETETFSGSVFSNESAVAGARVQILDDEGLPITMAVTDEAGVWSADVPIDRASTVMASGRGHNIDCDLPQGAGWYSPYAGDRQKEEALQSLQKGATPIAFAEGYGVSDTISVHETLSLELVQPGTLIVRVADDGPAVVRVDFANGDPSTVDTHLVPERQGAAGWLYLRDGKGNLPLAPGDYEITVHRGLRHSAHTQSISVASGEESRVYADIRESYSHAGVMVADPHSHAAPSGDGGIPMAERLVTHAAHGIDLHFGTDHDHIADYRVLLGPLNLQHTLGSVVADEYSPVLRGHFNLYPLQEVPEEPNNGAIRWWLPGTYIDTEELLGLASAQLGDGGIIQANHPIGSSGMFSQADLDIEAGTVGDPDHWSENFQAMEALNDGQYDDYVTSYLGLVSRGIVPTPVGVSDSHTYRNGVGENATFIDLGIDSISRFHPSLLTDAMAAQRTVVSHGPYIHAEIDGEWAPGATIDGSGDNSITLEVSVWAPTWMPLDSMELWENGVLIDSRPVTPTPNTLWMDGERARGSFLLEPENDAHYVVMSRASSSMAPVYPGSTPWAMTAAILVDLDGDGWDPPLPSLSTDR